MLLLSVKCLSACTAQAGRPDPDAMLTRCYSCEFEGHGPCFRLLLEELWVASRSFGVTKSNGRPQRVPVPGIHPDTLHNLLPAMLYYR